jgi:hypothetical protein
MGMDMFKERERSFEEEYFRKHEANSSRSSVSGPGSKRSLRRWR